MIIEELTLDSFGALRGKAYSFQPGLNVLLGPNEAGKSTLVNALFAVLFLPPDLRRSSEDWKNFLARCLPYPGGDTCRVSLRFRDAAGRRCTYTCSWGGRREARLLLEDGAEVNEPAAVRSNSNGRSLTGAPHTRRCFLPARTRWSAPWSGCAATPRHLAPLPGSCGRR